MKNLIVLFYILCIGSIMKAQDINWRSLDKAENKNHLVSLNVGAVFNTYYGFSYGYKLNGKHSIIPGIEVAVPFGNNLFDDWKVKLNGQMELWHTDKFSLGVKPGFIVRRYESTVARFYNLSADITTTFGYYRPKWGLASEVNYDKALSTNIKHDILKEFYPGIRDGWYGSTGGTFMLGAKANYAFKTWTVFLKAGKAYSQNFKNNPTFPFFAEVSIVKYL